jgi:hypothetical protein
VVILAAAKAAHQRRCVINVDVVKLNVLTSCDVSDSIRVLFRQFRQGFELAAFRPPAGILMRCMPGASQRVLGPLVKLPEG